MLTPASAVDDFAEGCRSGFTIGLSASTFCARSMVCFSTVRGPERPAVPDSTRVFLAGFDGDGQPVLGGRHRARRKVGERARQVRSPVEVKGHLSAGVRSVNRK